MDITAFRKSLDETTPPLGLTVHLESLWHDGKENWVRAHEIIQDMEDETASWIHAYLHRKEGDTWNADYWYRKAGKIRSTLSPGDEWVSLVNYCLQKYPVNPT